MKKHVNVKHRVKRGTVKAAPTIVKVDRESLYVAVGAAIGAYLGLSYAKDPGPLDKIMEMMSPAILATLKGVIPEDEWPMGSTVPVNPPPSAKKTAKKAVKSDTAH